MRCSYCKNNKGGAYRDWCEGFSFNLCVDCCLALEFIPNNLKCQKKCLSCGKYFTPKGSWQKDCTDCWLKAHPEKLKSFTFIRTNAPAQQKLNEVLHGNN